MSFSKLVVIAGNSGEWILDEPLDYTWVTEDGVEHFITVPAGFPTDLASIPRVFRILFPVNGKHRPAAVVHDYLYSHPVVLKQKTRAWCDKLFLQMMLELGVSRAKAYPMYWGVRTGGWLAW